MIKIWNKKESINGVDAETVLKSTPQFANEEVILIINDVSGMVTNIELPSILRGNLGLSKDLSTLEVGQAYVKHLEEQQKKVVVAKESDEKRIENLENTILQMQGVI